MVSCPTWSNNLGLTLMYMCVKIKIYLDYFVIINPWGDYDVGVSSQAVFFYFVNGLLIQFKSNKLDPLKQSIVNLFGQTGLEVMQPWKTGQCWWYLIFFSLFLLFVLVAFFSICKSGNSFYNTTMGSNPLWSCRILWFQRGPFMHLSRFIVI